MHRKSARGALLLAGIGLVLSLAACGKKAPLRLADDRVANTRPRYALAFARAA